MLQYGSKSQNIAQQLTNKLPLEPWWVNTQEAAVACCQVHLGINDISNVAGGQQRHPDELEHVGQVRLTLFSVVFYPV